VTDGIDGLLERMQAALAPMRESGDDRRHFLSMYARTTGAVGDEIVRGGFVDGEWTERWDLEFAELYLEALHRWSEDGSAPGPWQVAFDATRSGPRLPPLRHVLLGINAHVNYDLPQALLAVIDDDGFADPALIRRRAADHRHIDDIVSSRVAAEDELMRREEVPGDRTLLDRMLTPFNRAGSRRFLQEAREKVWRNAATLSRARRQGPTFLKARVDELGDLSAARVDDLRRPGQVILRLTRHGFGITLSEPETPPAVRLDG
jgi:hypothetical protein